jgi:hypothetical protein
MFWPRAWRSLGLNPARAQPVAVESLNKPPHPGLFPCGFVRAAPCVKRMRCAPVASTDSKFEFMPPSRIRRRCESGTARRRTPPNRKARSNIDALDREMAETNRLGRRGEVRRLPAKRMTLLSGAEWTEVLDFTNSLVLRADRISFSTRRTGRIPARTDLSPSIALESSLTAKVSVESGNRSTAFSRVFQGKFLATVVRLLVHIGIRPKGRATTTCCPRRKAVF